MKKVYKVNVVCHMCADCYYIGKELYSGVIDRMEEHSKEYEDHSEIVILIFSKDKLIGKLDNMPMCIEYEC